MTKMRSLGGPLVLVVVVVVALVVGSGLLSATPETGAQRSARLQSIVKCPSCEDLSVAQSTAPSALAVRDQITAMVNAGKSDREITSALVAQYGSTVLLAPPASGATLVLWLVPVLVGLGAIIGVVIFVVRKRRLDMPEAA